MFWNYQD